MSVCQFGYACVLANEIKLSFMTMKVHELRHPNEGVSKQSSVKTLHHKKQPFILGLTEVLGWAIRQLAFRSLAVFTNSPCADMGSIFVRVLIGDFSVGFCYQWNLICDRAFLGATIQSCFFVGMLVGSLSTGIFSDAWGRKKCIFVSNAVMVSWSR